MPGENPSKEEGKAADQKELIKSAIGPQTKGKL